MQYADDRNNAEPGMATADEVERLLQKAVADGLPPLTRLYHKGKAEPTAADAEPTAADAEPNSPEQKAAARHRRRNSPRRRRPRAAPDAHDHARVIKSVYVVGLITFG